MNLDSYKKYSLHAVRIALAAVYIFSGLVKGFDPMGTAIKVEEYLMAFSLDFFTVLSPLFAVLLCAMELFIGLLLLLNIQRKFTALVTLVVTAGFTLTTLYIYIASPVSDCGCFGDAIKLTNAETFYKNIVLVLMAIAIYRSAFKKPYYKNRNIKTDLLYFILCGVLSLSIPTQTTFSIPAVDFLPYQIGSNIQKSMEIPADAEIDQYEVVLKYKNIASGDIVEFSDTDTTWYDSNKWEFVDIASTLVKEGFTPKITSFDITNKDGVSVYKQLLQKSNMFFVVIYNAEELSKIDLSDMDRVRAISQIDGVEMAILTYDEIDNISEQFAKRFGFSPVFYNVDNIELKSMLRQSIGIFALQEGTIIGKSLLSADLEIGSLEDIGIFYEQQQGKKCSYLLCLCIVFILLIGSFVAIKAIKR